MYTVVVVVATALVVCLACVFYAEVGTPQARCTATYCPELPLCEQATLRLSQRLRCGVMSTPLNPSTKAYRTYVVDRLRRSIADSVKGQLLASSVVEMVKYKLTHPSEPMVLHFAGDNGVGKTRVAELVSLAYGQRCGDALCTMGDSTLVVSGTGYDGMSLETFRSVMVRLVVQHARQHPRDGVVVINELSSLEPSKVRVLLPLLGRASTFPEFPEVTVATQLVLLTTDFGREGRTRGKSLSEMRVFIDNEFKELYSAQSASYIRTLPFLPISLDTAADIVRVVVRDIGCAAQPPVRLAITDTAVLWLVEQTKPTLSVENGRAVAQETKLHVGSLMERLEEERWGRHTDEKTQDEDGAAPEDCRTPDCTVYVNDSGEMDVTC